VNRCGKGVIKNKKELDFLGESMSVPLFANEEGGGEEGFTILKKPSRRELRLGKGDGMPCRPCPSVERRTSKGARRESVPTTSNEETS